MTAVIDIVFLLIIFFLVVSQFIDTEDLSLTVPDACRFARDDNSEIQTAALSVARVAGDKVIFAVGSDEITQQGDNPSGIVERAAELIDARLAPLPVDSRIVTLRIDKDIPFSQAQYALAAVARSKAKEIRLAAMKEELKSTEN